MFSVSACADRPAPTPEPSTPAPIEAPASIDIAADVRAENDFTAELFRNLPDESLNRFASPASVRQCLTLLYPAARGETAAEIARALHLGAPADAMAALAAEERAFRSAAPTQGGALRIGNRVWTEKTATLSPSFLASLAQAGVATPAALDFHGAPEASRTAINQWVANLTENKIPEILPPGSITAQSGVVVSNAVYFRGLFAQRFPAAATAPAYFANTDGEVVPPKVPTMHLEAELPFATVGPNKVLELPYANSTMALDLVLAPTVRDALALEKTLDAKAFASFTASLRKQHVDVMLPKFRITQGGSIRPALEALGMRTAFTASADLGGLSSAAPTHMSDVFHRALIEVDEKGTEAAAATAGGMESGIAPPPATFHANHTFLFFLRDTASGRVLLVGRLARVT
ncbi:proteinase inhibitor I4, serpin [Minicystis rosea]|nr:proteinase inhibitor I4, serpin [Minicystis rosea]